MCRCVAAGVAAADLSFNEITVIEGLETMHKLTDLTLFHNKISELKGLESQRPTLQVRLHACSTVVSARVGALASV